MVSGRNTAHSHNPDASVIAAASPFKRSAVQPGLAVALSPLPDDLLHQHAHMEIGQQVD